MSDRIFATGCVRADERALPRMRAVCAPIFARAAVARRCALSVRVNGCIFAAVSVRGADGRDSAKMRAFSRRE